MKKIKQYLTSTTGIVKLFTRRITVKISRKRFTVLLTLIAIGWLISPRLPGILKLLSFVEKDFINSTSESIYESTKTHPEFQVRIGHKENPQAFTIAVYKEESSITFTGISYQPGKIMIPSTPVVPQLLDTIATSAAQSSQDSPTLASSSATQVTKPDETTATESAIPSQQQETVPEVKVEELSVATPSALPKAIDSIDQSLFGAYERLTLQGAVYPTISYHWEGSRLVETWNITSQNAEFSFKIEGSGLVINGENEQFLIFKDSTPVIELTSSIEDSNGAQTTVKQKVADGILTLSVDPDWISSPERVYPLTLRRNYQALANNQVDIKTVLATKIPPELVASAVEIPPETRFLNKVEDKFIFFDEKSSIVYELSHDTLNPKVQITDKLVALSCLPHECTAAARDGIYIISTTTQQETGPQIISLENKIPMLFTPVGGYARTEDAVFITQDTNPAGSLRKTTTDNQSIEVLLDNLNYAQEITTTPDGKVMAIWANGQLYVLTASGSFTVIQLPSPPIAMAAGSDGYIYSILSLDDGQDVIARSSLSGTEVLSQLRGAFTALAWKDATLYVVYAFNQQTSYLLQMPIETTQWERL